MRAALLFARRCGKDIERITAGLDGFELSGEPLSSPIRAAHWDTFSRLIDRIGDEFDSLEELGAAVESIPGAAMPLLASLAGGLITPSTLYHLMDESIAPALYPMLDIDFSEDLGDIDGGMRLPAPLRPSMAFMHAMVGLHRGAPRLLGLPSAEVRAVISQRELRLHIRPPSDPRAAGVVARSLEWAGEVARELAVLHAESHAAARSPSALRSVEASRTERLDSRARLWGLTPRERQVLDGLLRARSNKEIAHDLRCAVATIGTHIMAIFRKAEVRSRSELLAQVWDSPTSRTESFEGKAPGSAK